jgi:hypothetical protein
VAIGSNPCGCPEGIGNCAEAWDCIQTHICPEQGLTTAGGCLGVALGACLGFDPAGRIAYICGEEPEPGPCAATVDTLLADGFFVGGRHGGTGHVAAPGSPQAIDYALSMSVPLIEVDAFASYDRVLVWSGWDRTVDFTVWTNNAATVASDRPVADWMGTTSDPGTLANRVGRYKRAPAAQATPDGGYLGYGLPQFSLMLAETALRRVGGRAVVNLDLAYGQTPDTAFGSRSLDVTAAVQAVSGACAQQWAMVTVSYTSMTTQVPTLLAANITACVAVNEDTATTPAAVVATGAQWVRLRDTQTDARITSFVDAGLNVIVHTNSRHVETERAQGLGVAGIVADDPVYAADAFAAYGLVTFAGRQSEIGTLDYWTDQTEIYTARGYTRDNWNGLWIPNSPDVVAAMPATTSNSVLNFGLLGMLRFSAETVNAYTVEFSLRPEWNTRPTNSGLYAGLVISAINDVDMSGVLTGDYGTRYESQRSGYLCVCRMSNGQMLIYRLDGTSIPLLGTSATNVPLVSGTIDDFTITVTATGITFTNEGGHTVSVNDATYRGRYFYTATSNVRSGPQTYQAGFSVNPTI